MPKPTSIFTDAQLNSPEVSKKDLVKYLQEWASPRFQAERKLVGQMKSIAKTKSKLALIFDYHTMWQQRAFKGEGFDTFAGIRKQPEEQKKPEEEPKKREEDKQAEAAKEVDQLVEKTRALSLSPEAGDSDPKYKKVTVKKGDKVTYPKRGDHVLVYYKGMLQDGTVFDQNLTGGRRGTRKPQPFKFKVGKGLVVRGWDEALLTMCCGEKAEITIEPEWAYGRRGKPEQKIPPNATLKFEVELVGVE